MSEAAEFNPDVFAPAANSQKAFLKQYVPEDDDEGVIAAFERVKEYKPFLSQQRKEDVYEDVDFVRIVIRGNDKLEVHRPATDADKRRFPYAWQQYQAGKDHAKSGTPLDELKGMSPTMLPAFHARNVFTIEDLALVSDANLQNLGPGARDLRHQAREIVRSRSRGTEQDQRLDAALAANAELAKKLEQALAKIDTLTTRPRRKDAEAA